MDTINKYINDRYIAFENKDVYEIRKNNGTELEIYFYPTDGFEGYTMNISKEQLMEDIAWYEKEIADLQNKVNQMTKYLYDGSYIDRFFKEREPILSSNNK